MLMIWIQFGIEPNINWSEPINGKGIFFSEESFWKYSFLPDFTRQLADKEAELKAYNAHKLRASSELEHSRLGPQVTSSVSPKEKDVTKDNKSESPSHKQATQQQQKSIEELLKAEIEKSLEETEEEAKETNEQKQEKDKPTAPSKGEEKFIEPAIAKSGHPTACPGANGPWWKVPIPFPHPSCLNRNEQKQYLMLHRQLQALKPGRELSDKLKRELHQCREMRQRVLQEQDEYLRFMDVVVSKCFRDYGHLHPHGQRYIQECLSSRRERVHSYPRYYVQHDSASLMPPRLLEHRPLEHKQHLLAMGVAPKLILPNLDSEQVQRVPLLYSKVSKDYPACKSSSPDAHGTPLPCSKDPNCIALAKKYDVDIVLSSSTLKCILDNQPGVFPRQWELPLEVCDQADQKDKTRKVVYIDKELIPKELSARERNHWYHKYCVKALTIHPKHLGKVILGQQQSSSTAKNSTEMADREIAEMPDREIEPLVADDDPFGASSPVEDFETFGVSNKSGSTVKGQTKHGAKELDPKSRTKSDSTGILASVGADAKTSSNSETSAAEKEKVSDTKEPAPGVSKFIASKFYGKKFVPAAPVPPPVQMDMDISSDDSEDDEEEKLVIAGVSSPVKPKKPKQKKAKKMEENPVQATSPEIEQKSAQSQEMVPEDSTVKIEKSVEEVPLEDPQPVPNTRRRSSRLTRSDASGSAELTKTIDGDEKVPSKEPVKEEKIDDLMECTSTDPSPAPKRKRGRPPKAAVSTNVPETHTKADNEPSSSEKLTPVPSEEPEAKRRTRSSVQSNVEPSPLDAIMKAQETFLHRSSSSGSSSAVFSPSRPGSIDEWNAPNSATSPGSQSKGGETKQGTKDSSSTSTGTESSTGQGKDAGKESSERSAGFQLPGSFGAEWQSTEDPEDHKLPDGKRNVMYDLWTIGDLKLLVRSSCHGVHRRRKCPTRLASVSPKLEYHNLYGAEKLTYSDAMRSWMDVLLKQNSSHIMVRVCAFDGQVTGVEHVNTEIVSHPRAGFCPNAATHVLHDVLEKIHSLQVGHYLLSHTPGSAHATIKKTTTSTRGVYDLHAAYMNLNVGYIRPPQDPPPWVQIDTNIILPYHTKYNRVPATFEPKDSALSNTDKQWTQGRENTKHHKDKWKNKNKGKKNKGKKKKVPTATLR